MLVRLSTPSTQPRWLGDLRYPGTMLWLSRLSMARAAPWALVCRRSLASPAGLSPAARTATALLNSRRAEFQEAACKAPTNWLVLACSALGAAVMSSEAETQCMGRKRQNNDKPAAAKKKQAGPALGALEAALDPGKTFNVEKILATRLKSGMKEFLVRWQGYDEKHDSWEPVENLANLVEEMARFEKEKADENQKHLEELAKQKKQREDARKAAGSSSGAPSAEPEEPVIKEEPAIKDWKKKTARVYEAFKQSDTPGKAVCISTEGVAGGCQCGEEIRLYTQSLWNHVEAKHPRLYQELKGLLAPGAPIDGGIAASVGAGAAQTTLTATKFTGARKGQCDRACARWLIKSSRPVTLPVSVRPARTHARSS